MYARISVFISYLMRCSVWKENRTMNIPGQALWQHHRCCRRLFQWEGVHYRLNTTREQLLGQVKEIPIGHCMLGLCSWSSLYTVVVGKMRCDVSGIVTTSRSRSSLFATMPKLKIGRSVLWVAKPFIGWWVYVLADWTLLGQCLMPRDYGY